MSEFDQKAPDWDKNRMNVDRTIAVAEKLSNKIPHNPGLKALEFGAGTGLLSFHLKDRFTEITLMDSSAEMLKMAEQKMDLADRSRFRTLFFNLEDEDYGGEPFDVIYSQMVLHHVKDVESVFRKFHGMLKPGGMLAIADMYQENGSFHDFRTDVHRGFDPAELEKILLREGFLDASTEPCFIIRKETTAGKINEYPVFLLTAGR
jgi:2-polyprenyl-3-methyl-5-hydroxy-6-metoxy-1,4-benzoquinol methylase